MGMLPTTSVQVEEGVKLPLPLVENVTVPVEGEPVVPSFVIVVVQVNCLGVTDVKLQLIAVFVSCSAAWGRISNVPDIATKDRKIIMANEIVIILVFFMHYHLAAGI